MLHITMSNTVKVVLSCIALGFRKEKNTGVFLGSIYLSIHLCLCLRHRNSSPAALLGTVRGLEGASAGMQPNCRSILLQTLRLQCMHSNMSSFPLPPLTPKLKTLHWLSLCRVSHNLQSICNQPLGKLFTKEPLFFLAIRDTRIVPFLVYFCAPLITASPQFITMWVGDKLAGKSPKSPEWC